MTEQSDTWKYRAFLILFTLIIATIFIINAVDYNKIYNQWNESPEIQQSMGKSWALGMFVLNVLFAIGCIVLCIYNIYKLATSRKVTSPDIEEAKKKANVLEKQLKVDKAAAAKLQSFNEKIAGLKQEVATREAGLSARVSQESGPANNTAPRSAPASSENTAPVSSENTAPAPVVAAAAAADAFNDDCLNC